MYSRNRESRSTFRKSAKTQKSSKNSESHSYSENESLTTSSNIHVMLLNWNTKCRGTDECENTNDNETQNVEVVNTFRGLKRN